jgi:hypothetical protein
VKKLFQVIIDSKDAERCGLRVRPLGDILMVGNKKGHARYALTKNIIFFYFSAGAGLAGPFCGRGSGAGVSGALPDAGGSVLKFTFGAFSAPCAAWKYW